MLEGRLSTKLRVGLFVFVALMSIEIVEYLVGTRWRQGNWPLLGILAVIGAWPILSYFMHITQLRRSGE